MHLLTTKRSLTAVCLLAILSTALNGAVPISGRPVAELVQLDTIMDGVMTTYNISAGVLGVMKDGCIVYLRGFGWDDAAKTVPLQENAILRLASNTKPMVAAAAQRLAADGLLDLSDPAFDLPQCPGGVLTINPWPGLGDARICQITVGDLIDHLGGWDPDAAGLDWTYQECTIAGQVPGANEPPGRVDTLRFILGQPLDFNPGDTTWTDPGGNAPYSNINYLVLGLIVEQVSGEDLVTYLHDHVFNLMPWVSHSDVVLGRTAKSNAFPREPDYHVRGQVQNVFDCDGDAVDWPYGGWHHEARIGQGGFVASASAMLEFADRYNSDGVPVNPGQSSWTFFGSLPSGTNTVVRRRASEGVNYVVLFNRRRASGTAYASIISTQLDNFFDGFGGPWPTACVDGNWVDFAYGQPGSGTFDMPYPSLPEGVAGIDSGGRLRIKPGTTDWTGTLNKPMQITAPLGLVRVGVN